MVRTTVKAIAFTFLTLHLAAPSASASIITTGNGASIASSAPFPATTGTHIHTSGGPVDVGSWSNTEEVRGVAEFNLAAQLITGSATASFTVYALSGAGGQAGPGNYTIQVIAYNADNSIAVSDFQAGGTVVGSFSTSSLSVGQVLSFDVTSAYNANVGGSLGIRLQASTNPGTHTANRFTDFQITTQEVAAVPEPASLAIWGGLGLAGLIAARRRKRLAA